MPAWPDARKDISKIFGNAGEILHGRPIHFRKMVAGILSKIYFEFYQFKKYTSHEINCAGHKKNSEIELVEFCKFINIKGLFFNSGS